MKISEKILCFHQSANSVRLDNQTQRSPPKLLENPQKRMFQAGRASSFFLSFQLRLTAENGPIKVGRKKGLFFHAISGFSWDSSLQAQLATHIYSEAGIKSNYLRACHRTKFRKILCAKPVYPLPHAAKVTSYIPDMPVFNSGMRRKVRLRRDK